MKRFSLFSLTVLAALTVTSCDQSDDQNSQFEVRVEALEKENSQALKKQRALEFELDEKRLELERDVLERDRMLADEVRYALEQEGEATPGEVEGLLKREKGIAERELLLEGRHNDQFERHYDYRANPLRLSDEDLALAGRLVGGGGGGGGVLVEEEEELVEEDFYQELTPYGSWFESAEYGYVWQPAVSRDSSWRPYLRGRWACSDRGWTWISNEPFGWATYHYGRWANLGNGRGWIWVPGTEWAPSWCTWRQSSNSIGWAPLPPATQRGGQCDPCADVLPGVNAHCYTFVDPENFDQQISRVCVPKAENTGRLARAKNVTRLQKSGRRVFSGGPGYLDLSERIGRRVPFLKIERKSRDANPSKATRPGVAMRGERLVVTAPKVIPQARELSRPPRVRGAIENSSALSRPRIQPQVAIVQGPSQRGANDDLGDRVAEHLLPDLTQEAWEAGFPTAEMVPQKILLPELQTAALKPVEIKVDEVTAIQEGGERVARNDGEPHEDSSESVSETRAESTEERTPSRQREEASSSAREVSRLQPASRDDRDREEAEEGKKNPRGR